MPRSAHLIRTSTTVSIVQADLETHSATIGLLWYIVRTVNAQSAHLIRTSTTVSSVQADLEIHFLHIAHRFNSICLCYLCDGVNP